MKYFIQFSLFLVTTFAFSQSFKVSGILVDDENGSPLESATVFLETVKDSSLITYSISQKQGRFLLEGNTGVKKVRLNVSYVGYKSYLKEFELDKNIDLGVIKLKTSADELGEVVITSRAPVVIKKDTLEFNVASFKTKQDATVEDLLKQLPGVEVALDGTITVNGKPVSEIMVNGKPFFGNDPTIATKNLTKEMIEKIQITDTKSESEAFTGEGGDRESKTINLTIKEDRNRGVFGRVAGGVGTDKRYELAGLVNYFDNDRRVSMLVGGNNINAPGFSFGEIQKMFGDGNSSWRSSSGAFGIGDMWFGNNQGILESRLWGGNYADVVTKGFDVSADYFHSDGIQKNNYKIDRENILPERRYFTKSNMNDRTENTSDKVNMKFNIKIDSTFLVNIRPSFSFSKRLNDRDDDVSSFDELQRMTNTANTVRHQENDNRNFGNQLTITKKYGSRGGFFRVMLNNKWDDAEGDEFLYSLIHIYGSNPSEEIRNQRSETKNKETSYNAWASWQHPIYKKELFIDFTYSFSNSKTKSSKFVNDFSSQTMDFTDFNQDFSTDYLFLETRSRPMASLAYRSEGKNFRIGGGYATGKLEGEDHLRPDLRVENRFEGVEAFASGYAKLSPTQSLNLYYNLRNQAPSVRQLLPGVDVSNPLNIITGNPNLDPSQMQNIYVGFSRSDFQKGQNIWFNLNGSWTDRAVVSKSVVDENNLRTTTYENVNGLQRFNPSVFVNKKFKLDSIRSLTIGGGMWSSLNRSVNFNNGVQYVSKNNTYGPNVELEFMWDDLIELNVEYDWGFTQSRYKDNVFPKQNFQRHTLGIEAIITPISKLDWNNTINYNYTPDVDARFQKTALLWNSSITYSILKDKGIVSLKVYDLLNRNTNTSRYATEDYIQDTETNMLKRYFMLGFSYKFNTMKGAGEQAGDDF